MLDAWQATGNFSALRIIFNSSEPTPCLHSKRLTMDPSKELIDRFPPQPVARSSAAFSEITIFLC